MTRANTIGVRIWVVGQFEARMHYNFARTHKTLANPYPRTPAMAAGLAEHVWSIEEIVQLASSG